MSTICERIFITVYLVEVLKKHYLNRIFLQQFYTHRRMHVQSYYFMNICSVYVLTIPKTVNFEVHAAHCLPFSLNRVYILMIGKHAEMTLINVNYLLACLMM